MTERAATVRHVSNIPLPRGFKHTLRVTDSKPGGWVQYEAQCPVHGNLLKADRVAKLVDIFKAHAQCRSGVTAITSAFYGQKSCTNKHTRQPWHLNP